MNPAPYPTIRWIRNQLRYDAYAHRRIEILEAFIVGSEAKGTATPTSDLDIAIVIPSKRGKSSLDYTEAYHLKFPSDQWKPHWNGRRLDYQFYYPGELPQEYSKIALG